MKNIVTIGGSNSKNSINKVLAEYVGNLVQNVNLIKVDLNDYKMPLFSVDEEAENGFSEGLLALNEIIENADGFVISLAEHNGAYSVAFKNAFDWLSRINSEVWRKKPMLLMATSPGARGGQTMLDIAAGRFPYMGAQIVGSLSFPSFFENFKNEEITNKELAAAVQKMISDLEKAL
jgi:NAD(P)H-dependent FMN reductase